MTKFEKKCREVNEKLGLSEIMFFKDESKGEPVEDDGTLHVTVKGLRACFDVSNGQSSAASEQNRLTKEVLKELGMETKYNPDQVLVGESEDDEDDYCPHCGRGDC